MSTALPNTMEEWPTGWSVERYLRATEDDLQESASLDDRVKMNELYQKFYPQAPLRKEDGEPAWPEGWSIDRWRKRRVEETFAIPIEDVALMRAIEETFYPTEQPLSVEEILANNAAIRARRRAELSLPPTRPTQMTGQIVQTVEKLGLGAGQPWGFLLFRSDYSDDERFETFMARFMEMVSRSVDPDQEVGWERICDYLSIGVYDQPELNGCGLEGNRKLFHAESSQGEIQPGLNGKLFLVVDSECIASVLDTEGEVPFVLAQDADFEAEDGKEAEGYRGIFKVSVDSLLKSLYVCSRGMNMSPRELWSHANPIFQGTELS